MKKAPFRRWRIVCPVLSLAFALAGCGGEAGGPRSAGTIAPAASPLETAVDALNQGDEKGAQKALHVALKANPNNAEAKVLMESISVDPVTLLGAKSFSYTAQSGDTMLGLSQRFLGNRLKFYQLSRYNKLARPDALSAGTVLHIPGEAPKAAPSIAPEPGPSEAPKAASRTKPKPKAAPTSPAASGHAPKPATDNPAVALRLRGQGLAALNQGKIANAVGLLRRAAALDPANPLIARDLARAERIAQAVQAHR